MAMWRGVDQTRQRLAVETSWIGGRVHRSAVVVFGLALAVRVLYNVTVAYNYVPRSDAAEYVGLAQHLLRWGCYCRLAPGEPTTIRPPLFPLFLAAVNLLGGVTSLQERLALSVVGAVTCLLVSGIAGDLFGRRAGVLAGLIAATYPQLFIYDAWLYSESLAICLFAASCLAVMRIVRQPVSWRWALVGGLVGLTALARPNGIYALGAVVVWAAAAVATRVATPRRALLGAGLVALGCMSVLAPWVVRNYIVTGGAFVPATTVGGIVLAGSYNDQAYSMPGFSGSWVNPYTVKTWDATDRALLDTYRTACWAPCEVGVDHATTEVAFHWASAHRQLLPRLVALRMRQFWAPASPPGEAGMPIWRRVAVAYPALVMGLAALGLFALRRRWYDALVPLLFGATIVGGAIIFYGSPRMRAPLEPILVALAAGGAVWLIGIVRARQPRRAALVPVESAPVSSASPDK